MLGEVKTPDARSREIADLKRAIATLKSDLERCERLVLECNKALKANGKK